MITVRDMIAFRDNWKGQFFSECGGLMLEADRDPSVLNLPVYVYTQPSQIVFTTVENDTSGFQGSSFIAVLAK